MTIGITVAAMLAAGGMIFFVTRGPEPPSDPRLQQALRDLQATIPWHHRLENSRLVRRLIPDSWYPPARIPKGRFDAFLKVNFLHWKGVEQFRLSGTNAWSAIPPLLDLLDSRDVEIRNCAALSLAVIQAADHPEWPEQSRTLQGRPRAAHALHHWVRLASPEEPFADTRPLSFGLLGLGAVGTAADWTRPEVMECLRAQKDPAVRAAAVFALGRLTPDPTNGLPLLRQLLANTSEWPEVSGAAATALIPAAKTDGAVADLLRQGLKDPRARVRIAAADACRRLGRPSSETMPVLVPLLRHSMRAVRIETLQAVGGIGPDARDALDSIRALESDPDPVVARAASDAFKRVAGASE